MLREVAKYINEVGGVLLKLSEVTRKHPNETFEATKSTYECSSKAHSVSGELHSFFLGPLTIFSLVSEEKSMNHKKKRSEDIFCEGNERKPCEGYDGTSKRIYYI